MLVSTKFTHTRAALEDVIDAPLQLRTGKIENSNSFFLIRERADNPKPLFVVWHG